MDRRKRNRRKKYAQRALCVLVVAALVAGVILAVNACTGGTPGGEESSSQAGSQSGSEEPSSTVQNSSSKFPASSETSSQAPSKNPSPEPPASSQGPKEEEGIYAGMKWRSPTAVTCSVKYGWNLVLVNNDYELPTDFKWNLVSFATGKPVDVKGLADSYQAVDQIAYQPLKDLFAAAAADGVPLQMVSAYRSIDLQNRLFGQYVTQNMSKGMSEQDAIKKANTLRTFTGTSEHNTGLGFDILEKGNFYLSTDFEKTPAFRWLQEHAADYGFILRYEKDKTNITGISYEPWHYRYVGVEHAKKIKESGMCFEEYIESLGGV